MKSVKAGSISLFFVCWESGLTEGKEARSRFLFNSSISLTYFNSTYYYPGGIQEDMPVLTTIRQSPAYLYVKTYCLCAIITLFQAAPVSSRLPQIEDKLHLKHHLIRNRRLEPRVISTDRHETPPRHQPGEDSRNALRGAACPLISGELSASSPKQFSPRKIVRRWLQRAVDLSQIKKQLRNDDKDFRTYPELDWDATVRRSSSIHPEERRFIEMRKHRISSQGVNALHHFLNLPEDERAHPGDIPLIALGGSGGGYRAMYGFAAFMSASKKLGLWDCLTWTAGVSGSCWTLAAYYTIANHDISKLIGHYLSIAKELAHPMSLHAFNTVVRSSKGVCFLIGPLVRKVRSGIIGLGVMDLYGTLTTTYQFLSRQPGARLSRATFQFSKVWTRSGIDQGIEPMPIFTAVRRAPKDSSGVKPHTDSSLSRGQPPKRALTQHQTKVSDAILHHQNPRAAQLKPNLPPDHGPVEPLDSSLTKGFFQWFEISPLEVGSPDVQGYIPTWSWGRSFVSGHSVGRPPEQSLSLLLGQCTSAPAGPLTGYISALLASLPNGTAMSRLLLLLNDFVRMKNWESLWGNPIRAGHDPNPFYGHNNGPLPHAVNGVYVVSHGLTSHEQNHEPHPHHNTHSARNNRPVKRLRGNMFYSTSDLAKSPGAKSVGCKDDDSNISSPSHTRHKWEMEGRIRLMDSGMSNNLPSHILARPSRRADIILAFDASSDVQNRSAIRRIQNFADDCHLELEDETALFDPPEPHFRAGADSVRSPAMDVEERFLHHYARVFRGKRENGMVIYLVYCPLLPNGGNPGFDPSVSPVNSALYIQGQ
jgi:phospholipase A2